MCADVGAMACSHYHAAMTQQEREEVQANWTHDRMQIIVATIAFGMGQHTPSVPPECCFWPLPAAVHAQAGMQLACDSVGIHEGRLHRVLCISVLGRHVGNASKHGCALQASISQTYALSCTSQSPSLWRAIIRWPIMDPHLCPALLTPCNTSQLARAL